MVESCSYSLLPNTHMSQEAVNANPEMSLHGKQDYNGNPESGDHVSSSSVKSSFMSQPLDTNKEGFEKFVNKLFSSILETVDEDIMCHCIKQLQKFDDYAGEIVQNVMLSSFNELLPALSEHNNFVSINAFANKLVTNAMFPIVNILENGILDYASDLSKTIVESATVCAAHKLQQEHIAHLFAEKFSLRVFRDFFIHIITDANRIAYHLLGSYQAVSTNQLHSFADAIMENILKDIFPHRNQDNESFEDDLLKLYASSLSNDILYYAIEDVNKAAMASEKNKASSIAVEKYASQMVGNLFTDLPTSTSRRHSCQTSTHLQVCYRRNSSDDHSEAITPRSVGSDSYWKRGIYHFADQLLYSLTALEDDESDKLSELGDPVKYRKERKWGSCPHIYDRPFVIPAPTWRRKSETVLGIRKKLLTYAEDLSDVIVSSVLPSFGKREF